MKSLLLSVTLLGTFASSTIISASTTAEVQDTTVNYEEFFTALNGLYAYTYEILDAAVAQTEPQFQAEAQQVADTLKQQLQEQQSLINEQRSAIIEHNADYVLEQAAQELITLISQLVEQK